MKWMKLNILILMTLCFSCVAPNDIELGGNSQWVVYGLVGENEAPVIFVYGVQIVNNQLIYNYEAEIEITDQQTNQKFMLYPAINQNLQNIGSSEFPFGQDIFGNVVYYTSNIFKPQKGRNYSVNLNLGSERGAAILRLPESIDFSNVELRQNDNDVSRVLMSIDDDASQENYYKWEVRVNQTLNIPFLSIDTTSGDTIENIVNQEINAQFLPSNYINEVEIIENENVFKFNLSANLIDYPDFEETYLLNVRLRHFGTEVVEYFKSIEEQDNSSLYDPFIEPVFIKSNIDGIIGLIGTYSYSPPHWIEYQP
jgi:hypothetical protein